MEKIKQKPKKQKKSHEGLGGKILAWAMLIIMLGSVIAGILVYFLN